MNKEIIKKFDLLVDANKYKIEDVTELNYTNNVNKVYEISEKYGRLKMLLTVYPNITERIYCTKSENSIFTQMDYEELNSFVDSILKEEE